MHSENEYSEESESESDLESESEMGGMIGKTEPKLTVPVSPQGPQSVVIQKPNVPASPQSVVGPQSVVSPTGPQIQTDQIKERDKQDLEYILRATETALKAGITFMLKRQEAVIDECMKRTAFGLSLPMGQGKTFISLILGLRKKLEQKAREPLLVIASKSIIGSCWKSEINKFFGDLLKYQIIDGPKFNLEKDTLLVLVTPETAGRFYTKNNITEKFVIRDVRIDPLMHFPVLINYYKKSKVPYLQTAIGGSVLYSKKWAALIVDEGHKYTNIISSRSQAICAICADHRWILSGTLFDEPKYERVLGYYTMLQLPNFPDNLPDATEFMSKGNFKGTACTVVERSKIPLKGVKINKHIIQHDLSVEEGQIYVSMKNTISILQKRCKLLTKAEKKKFSTYILSMITYIRQSVVNPIIPIANIALEMSELKEIRSELSVLLMDQFNKLNISHFLEDEASVKSSRIKHVLEAIQNHSKPTDKIIAFSCFCTSIDVLKYFVNEEIPIDIYHLESSMSITGREKLVNDFNTNQNNSILFTTYELGAEGLNLQSANVVLILDFWWNSSKTQQAIARVIRSGQKAEEVDIYFFTSNTGIEKALFSKQQDKLLLLDEIKHGTVKTKVKSMGMNEVLKLIDANENHNYISSNY